MALSDVDKQKYSRRLLMSRTRVLCTHGFYGLLLMHAKFGLDESCNTAYTDGERIVFSPAFMDKLSDSELDFILMHEILHIVLDHCNRGENLDDGLFNIACDIVVNSNVLKANDNKLSTITLSAFGESMHKAPNGKEGHLYTAEEVYAMLESSGSKKNKKQKGGQGNSNSPEDSSQDGDGDKDSSDNDKSQADGDSNINSNSNGNGKQGEKKKSGNTHGGWDDHSHWSKEESSESDKLRNTWLKRLSDAVETVSIEDPTNEYGTIPAAALRLLKELKHPTVDWKTLLDEFVQEEICDYSLTPPDRRYSESDFFLPDLNDTDFSVENVLFMIDTSGSISNDMVVAAYSEIAGAIDQFGGKLKGLLGFFDAAVYKPIPFESVDDVKAIKPRGGGGTSFDVIFEYVAKNMTDEPPVSIVILTDGYAPFPDEKATRDIPVLWLINNDDVTPPWGKVARIKL